VRVLPSVPGRRTAAGRARVALIVEVGGRGRAAARDVAGPQRTASPEAACVDVGMPIP
jgi:hypothetical protein